MTQTEANPLWGGRFQQGASSLLEQINASVQFDHRLADQDIAGSIAHCRMLATQGVITKIECDTIVGGLELVADEVRAGKFAFDAALEDVHMNIVARLYECIGPVAG